MRIPLSELSPGRRVRVVHREIPVEVTRDASGEVTARSLLCTHMGCEVRWIESSSSYHCPCHGGVFDASGMAVAGPPTRPLAEVPTRIIDSTLWVGG